MKEHAEMTDKTNRGAEWLWRMSLLLVLGILGFFLRDVYYQQREFNDGVQKRVAALELKMAETAGNRFTSGDWVTAKGNIDGSIQSLQVRIQRVEDAVVGINATLTKIDNKLDRVLETP
jgi:hypothetical protein